MVSAVHTGSEGRHLRVAFPANFSAYLPHSDTQCFLTASSGHVVIKVDSPGPLVMPTVLRPSRFAAALSTCLLGRVKTASCKASTTGCSFTIWSRMAVSTTEATSFPDDGESKEFLQTCLDVPRFLHAKGPLLPPSPLAWRIRLSSLSYEVLVSILKIVTDWS